MAETQATPAGSEDTRSTQTGFGRTEVALAVGLSAAFVFLAVAISPLVAAAVVVPVSIATGRWRAHTLPGRIPHSLSAPEFSSQAVIHAPRVSPLSGDKNVITAA